MEGQIGLEETSEAYIAKLVAVFAEVKRVLRDDGTLWVNIGDSYAGSGGAGGDYSEGGLKDGQPKWKSNLVVDRSKRNSKRWGGGNLPATGSLKPKDLIGIPWMLAFALRADGWYLRQDIIWHKPNPMPESVTDRCTKAHEYIFLLAKSQRYYYDADAVREPFNHKTAQLAEIGNRSTAGLHDGRTQYGDPAKGRNRRSVWTVTTKPYKEAHFATFPPDLIEPCILAGSKAGDTVLDPFNGSGTTGQVAIKHGRDYIGVELNPEYITLTERRLAKVQPIMVSA